MRFFYDTEFIEDGETIDLISIGMVCENGETLYAQNADCRFSRADQWAKTNVLPRLTQFHYSYDPVMLAELGAPWYRYCEFHDLVLGFVEANMKAEKPEFWGYYADYDHVALCQIFGRMIDLPKGFPMYTRDLKQWCDQLGNPQLPEQEEGEHNALADALWNKRVYAFLENKEFLLAKS